MESSKRTRVVLLPREKKEIIMRNKKKVILQTCAKSAPVLLTNKLVFVLVIHKSKFCR
jgi:hypothetical protein